MGPIAPQTRKANSPSLKELFHSALALDGEQRSHFLEESCHTDPRLLRQLKRLLAAHQAPQKLLDSPSFFLGATTPPGENPGLPSRREQPLILGSEEGPGSTIGQFQLLEQIGEGGMGAVFKAVQTHPVKRLVALKLIKPGMDSRQILTRFDIERKTLALMDHPNIARVLDAGTTHSGRPFFVMELVQGLPLTEYCDEKRLSVGQRLELFLSVCQAVQHAHQKGIIHRDLKPTNILVTECDGQAIPKVIDFGVAKAVGPQLTESTLITNFGTLVGTLEYMSPEQADFQALDIDTRSDIYSLGVILYETLTGSPPLDKKKLRQGSFQETLRLIREQEPVRPSSHLAVITKTDPWIATRRHIDPKRWIQTVKGDLDWIVMKCLEKDRSRRYETANDFALDLQRFLSDEPVLACPPSLRYRMGKFVRRNKSWVAAGCVMMAALVCALVGTSLAFFHADQARREANQLRDQAEDRERLVTQALQSYSPLVDELLFKTPGMVQEQKKLLLKVRKVYRDLLETRPDDLRLKEPLAQASWRLARVYSLLNQLDEGKTAVRESIDLFTEVAQADPAEPLHGLDLARSYSLLREILAKNNELAQAGDASGRAVSVVRSLAARDPSDLRLRDGLACYLKEQASFFNDFLGDRVQAQYLFQSALMEAQVCWKANPEKWQFGWQVFLTQKELAYLSCYDSDIETRMKAFREALASSDRLIDQAEREISKVNVVPLLDFHHTRIEVLGTWVSRLLDVGRLDEAEKVLALLKEATEKFRRNWPDQNRGHSAGALGLEGWLEFLRGNKREAAQAFARYRAVWEGLLQSELDKKVAHINLAVDFATSPVQEMRDPVRALRYAEEAIKAGPQDPAAHYSKGVALASVGRFSDAKLALIKSLQMSGNNPKVYLQLALCEARLNHPEEAKKWVAAAKPLMPNPITFEQSFLLKKLGR